MATINTLRPATAPALRLPRFARRTFLPFVPATDAPLFHAWRP